MSTRKKWLIAVVALAWLATGFWLIRYEAYPDLFADAIDGYGNLFREGVLQKDAWMKIVFKNTPIGYSHTRVDVNENDPARYYLVQNRTFLKMRVLGEPQRITVNAAATLNSNHRLREFAFSLVSGEYRMRIEGLHSGGETFQVEINTGAQTQKQQVTVPADAILYSPMTEMALRQLRPGQKITIKAFDPTTMTTASVLVQAIRKEPLCVRGRREDTTVLAVDYRGLQVYSWIGADGSVLRQETPFGWVMESCEADEALSLDRGPAASEDVLLATAPPTTGFVERPRECRKLRLRLTGGNLDGFSLASNRQRVEQAASNEVVLTTLAASAPKTAGPIGRYPADLRPFLVSSPYLQSEHPDVVARARKICEGKTNQWEAAVAIHDWVHKNVQKASTVSFPSALDILQRRRGDCNEHTYLFVALARAAGLPARIIVGLAYAREGFYYHAWPAVYAGDWIEMDPTFGQITADATHISLLEGEIQDQMKLMQVFGRLRVEILGVED